nr:unnamed protein product [Spirometra erinaceieuropaei]
MAEEEISFLRTGDFICLSCLSHGLAERLCLGAEGFGNRMCSLECIARETPPPNMPPCVFLLEQALSARALQEMLSSKSELSDSSHSSHRTLLYGHAVRLKHRNSGMYLACLSTSSTEDKLAFDVGLEREADTEACWWTIHPASKQRSVGEKVRIGDDLILVSVSSERYLHVYGDSFSVSGVIASFQQTLWTVIPISSGIVRQKSLHMAFGGDVIRLFHGDECLTIETTDSVESGAGQALSTGNGGPGGSSMAQQLQNEYHQSVMYQLGSISGHARSLWQIEHTKTKWCAGFFSWDCAVRLRHVTTGRYLGIIPQGGGASSGHIDVFLLPANEANNDSCVFYIKQTKDDKKKVEDREQEGMGDPDVRLGETLIYLQHASTGWWLSYDSYETKKRGVGKVEEKKAVLLAEGHMDDVFSLVRAQEEESTSAAAIRRSTAVLTAFNRALDGYANTSVSANSVPNSTAAGFGGAQSTGVMNGGQPQPQLNMEEVSQCLDDLIDFFAQPDLTEEHEVRQAKLAALSNRQDLFQEEGMIGLALETIDKFTGTFRTRREFAQVVGEEKGNQFSELGNYLYLLLAALIRGNHENCAQFAAPARLNWLFNRLELQQSFAEGVLDALHCVLTDSDEALNVITPHHIRTLIGLLDKQGRDPRVLEVLRSICMGRQGGAVRLNQDLIYDCLLPERDLLLQTKLVSQSGSMRANLFVGTKEGGSMYTKWYFEVFVDALETISHQPATIRVGWCNTDGYLPHPVGGPGWGGISLGDDFYSFGFDGRYLWTGGKRKLAVYPTPEETKDPNYAKSVEEGPHLKHGDVIGCLLDLTGPVIQFNLNGSLVKGYFQDFNTTGLFYPCVSMTARASARLALGGNQGRLRHGPPAGYAPIIDAMQPNQRLRLEPVFSFGRLEKAIYAGPSASPMPSQDVYVPQPINTNKVHLPIVVERIRDKLAENMHELWAMRKLEQGWTFGEKRDDVLKKHPNLTLFDKLPQTERQYSLTMALEMLKTTFALHFNIGYESLPEGTRMKTVKLPSSFIQSNGYKPQPLDLSAIRLSSRLETLVDQLAENTHNIWAKDRITQGWTYGPTEDNNLKRSPHLVPYSETNANIKRSNRETAYDSVKTLLVYGYTIEAMSGDSGEHGAQNALGDLEEKTMNYRAQVTRAVTRGKWYYEVELLTSGMVRVGWATALAPPDVVIGMRGSSYAFAPDQARKYHREGVAYGKFCQPGDVIGCMLNLTERNITFSLNGEIMMDPLGQEIAFKDLKPGIGYVPAYTLGSGQQVKVNFGNVVQTLKYFTVCGLQEGYSPFAVNMSQPVPMWYSKVDPSLFVDLDKNHHSLETKVSGAYPPTINILAKAPSPTGMHPVEYLRLSLGIKCKSTFTTRSQQERHANLDNLRHQFEPEVYPHSPMGIPGDPTNLALLAQDMTSSTLEVRDRRGKKNRLANPFKKARSRDASPEVSTAFGGPGSLSLLSGTPSGSGVGSNLGRKVETGGAGSLLSGHQGAFASNGHDTSAGTGGEDYDLTLPHIIAQDNAIADFMDEYAYTVLIPPGQNPGLVNVGWVLSNVKISKPAWKHGVSPFYVDPDFNTTQTTDSDQMNDGTTVTTAATVDTPTAGAAVNGTKQGQKFDDAEKSQEDNLELAEVRQVAVCLLEQDLSLKTAVAERSSFLVNAGELLQRIATADDVGKRMSQGLAITCWVDIATGTLGFKLNDRETGIRFQVEPSTHLFAAAYVRPTARDCLQFELGRRSRYHLPLPAGMVRPPRRINMPLPHRLTVQTLERVHWAPVPSEHAKVYCMKMSDQRGWSMLLENTASKLVAQCPETNRCFSIFELEERPDLLRFHAETLALYRAICCHGNHNIAQRLTTHVDKDQLLHVVTSKHLSGSLRSQFIELLLAMHLESHMKLKKVTGREFIVPLEREQLETKKSRSKLLEAITGWDPDHVPAVNEHRSIRPELITDPHLLIPGADGTGSGKFVPPVSSSSDPAQEASALANAIAAAGPGGLLKLADCPPFPVDMLKRQTLDVLIDIVNTGGHVRDPFGGTFEHALLPLLRIVNHLLVMGSLDANDLSTVLCLLNPKAFPLAQNWRTKIIGSLLDLPLPESVKLEVCHLFQNLCDLRLRHRIESVISFANTAVGEIQNDQLQRYMAIKVSNLPSSVAARRTREFRCPPKVQIQSLMHIPGPGGPTGLWEELPPAEAPAPASDLTEGELADLEEEDETHPRNPCSEEIKDLLRLFHRRLMDHLGVVRPEVQVNWDYEAVLRAWQETTEPTALKQQQYRGPNTVSVPSSDKTVSSTSLVASSPTYSSTTTTTTTIDGSDCNLSDLSQIPLLPDDIGDPESGFGGPPRAVRAIWHLLSGPQSPSPKPSQLALGASNEPSTGSPGHNLTRIVLETVTMWTRASTVEDVELIRQLFSLLYRQYGALDELREGLQRTYTIGYASKGDVTRLLRSLGRIRSLLGVQVGSNEETLLKNCLWDIMNNNVFFQHPDLIRVLAVHETVMQLMVHTLSNAALESTESATHQTSGSELQLQQATDSGRPSPGPYAGGGTLPAVMEEAEDASGPSMRSAAQRSATVGSTDMVVQCCRFLCYFCRTSWQNQKAMFDHLSYMLENSSMLLARPSLRGTCPLDVAYSSLMDNNELALALREKQLEKVAVYLSRCGVQSNAELLAKGYPDIGWDPVEGERFLDFLRFTVWVNGETVEENANLVVRLLIRRPECLGPALRGGTKVSNRRLAGSQPAISGIYGNSELPPGSPEGANDSFNYPDENQSASLSGAAVSSAGGGLLKGIKEGIVMSAQIKLVKMAMEAEANGLNPEDEDLGWRTVLMDYEDANLFVPLPYNFATLPPEDDDDYVDLGAAILTFYSVLVDLLGRCAPDVETTKSESVRGRAILQSLVSMQDLEGVLSLRFILPPPKLEMQVNAEGIEVWVDKSSMPPGLLPEHKASVVRFMERVYGLSDADTFVRLLENAFLPDMRAVTLLDSAQTGQAASDMTLALYRYICGSVLPLLTRYAHFLSVNDVAVGLLEATLHTAYRLSMCRSITNSQREVVSNFLVALIEHIQPSSMTNLLRKIATNMRSSARESSVSLRILTTFYQRFGSYYSSEGWTGADVVVPSTGDNGTRGEGKNNVGGRSGGESTVTATGQFARTGAAAMATEEEKNATAELFSLIFNKLSNRAYDAELYTYALPCLCAIGCALPPDYCSSHWNAQPKDMNQVLGRPEVPLSPPGGPENDARQSAQSYEAFRPEPLDTAQIRLPNALSYLVDQFAQHCHDVWAQELVEQGYVYGPTLDETRRSHPNIRPFHSLSQHEQIRYIHPVTDTLRAMMVLGWTIDTSSIHHEGEGGFRRRRPTLTTENPQNYNPAPKDLHSVNVTRELIDLAERLADNAHQIWAKQKMQDLEAIGGGVHQLLVPYDILTDRERKRYRRLTHELIRYLQFYGYRLKYKPTQQASAAGAAPGPQSPVVGLQGEKGEGHPSSRFAYGLLSKLLDYVESAMTSVKESKPSQQFSRRHSSEHTSEEMKLLVKVVLPLVERYFNVRKNYFTDPYSGASIEEKKMATMLFCKLFTLLRLKTKCFGSDVNVTVSCLKCLIQTIDVKAIVKISYAEDFVRVRLLPFFTYCADDLNLCVRNLEAGRYSHIKGTIRRGACSIHYVHMILLPTVKTMFEHISKTLCGDELLVGNLQVTCYRILNALYMLGTRGLKHTSRPYLKDELNRHRPVLGECLAALASCFPVAFLETELSANNPLSITYHSEEADYSFEARDLLRTIGQTLPTLNDIIDDIARLAEAGSNCADEPHLIEVTLPMLCSYLPFWWRRNKQAQDQLARASGRSYEADQFDDDMGPAVGELADGVENKMDNDNLPITTVTADLMNRVLGSVLQLIQNNIDSPCAPWMTRIATRTQPIVGNATIDMLGKYFLPVSERLLEQAMFVEALEEAYKAEKKLGNEASDKEAELVEAVELLVRNTFALYPLLIKFVDSYRSHWLHRPTLETERLFNAVARLFLVWAGSAHFKREEETFVGVHEIDTLSLIMPSAGLAQDVGSQGSSRSSMQDQSRASRGKRPKTGAFTSLMVASVKRLLPIGLSELGGRQQELVQRAKKMLLKRELVTDIIEYLKAALDREDDSQSDHRGKRWQKLLYEKIDRTIALTGCHAELGLPTKEDAVRRIFVLARVMHGIYIHDHPTCTHRGAWKKLLSSQRKRAVMACFRMMPLYAMPRHRAINLFLYSYHAEWLEHEQSRGVQLIDDITKTAEDSETVGKAGEGPEASTSAVSTSVATVTVESPSLLVRSLTDSSISDSSDTESLSALSPGVESLEQAPEEGASVSVGEQHGEPGASSPDPLHQLLTALCRTAMAQEPNDPLYLAYAKVMAKSCSGEDEDDEGGDDGDDESEGPSFQEQEEQKQKLLSEQNRLADRGAAEMVLLQLAAARGEATAVAQASIELGIAILLEGNVNVQNRMLKYLDEKRLTGFFTSLAGLMQNCSVLDLDTFERCNKAEGLAVGLSDMEGITNLYDADFTCKIFRFLQLLCEGHNLEFQDYLRTQSGNTTSVNLIICTVDYLLRLQESIMDFYWHYSNKPVIDESGKKNFIKAIKIGKQLFRTLTEYIQGPCQGNQLALAHSRLWDAISGFFYLFAHMQDNLSKDPEQLELLHEFLNLQTEMMIMLLSMLEGNVVNGPIGRQMVDTLAESSANVELALTFFDIFLRMKEITTSDAFLAFDVNKDGWISHREFRTALEQQKTYSEDEINYIMGCVDANSDGKIDFQEFTERFYNPARDIGFNVALLLTNLSEHIPGDSRLDRLLVKAKGMLETFEPYLGRIEITNKSGSIERVYFEIRQQNIDQWEKPQIKDSKRAFLHTVVGESGDKEKLECFVNFAEDTIFEMQHAEEISGDDDNLQISRVVAVRNFLETTHLACVGYFLAFVLSFLQPSQLLNCWSALIKMSLVDIVTSLLGLTIGLLIGLTRLVRAIVCFCGRFFIAMASDPTETAPSSALPAVGSSQGGGGVIRSAKTATDAIEPGRNGCKTVSPSVSSAGDGTGGNTKPESNNATSAESVDLVEIMQQRQCWLLPEAEQLLLERIDPTKVAVLEEKPKSTTPRPKRNDRGEEKSTESAGFRQATATPVIEEGTVVELKPIPTSTFLISIFARNFYRFKLCALILAFLINFLLLCYRIEKRPGDEVVEGTVDASESLISSLGGTVSNLAENLMGETAPAVDADGDDMDAEEWITLADSAYYLGPVLRILAIIHSLFSFSMLVAYYFLKVPLVIFKREKEISRMLEFDGMWISEQPTEDNFRAHWDKLVLSTPSFPHMYWDKFVKKKVLKKFKEQYDQQQIINLLGMTASDTQASDANRHWYNPAWLRQLDVQYLIWKWGVIFTDNSFLYLIVYFFVSTLGNLNYFFFSCHLLDVAISFKTLNTIVQSVTHNGKQLVLTETYVWELYQQRCWDFFPIGNCFRKQYEEELQAK